MQASVRWTGGLSFAATAGSGATAILDATPEAERRGPSPMEALLISLAGCTGMDVVSILEKMRAPLKGLEVNVSGERAAEHPRVFTHLTLEYVFTGTDLAPDQVRRAIMLSEERYCSVSAMVRRSAALTYSWRIVGTPHRG